MTSFGASAPLGESQPLTWEPLAKTSAQMEELGPGGALMASPGSGNVTLDIHIMIKPVLSDDVGH